MLNSKGIIQQDKESLYSNCVVETRSHYQPTFHPQNIADSHVFRQVLHHCTKANQFSLSGILRAIIFSYDPKIILKAKVNVGCFSHLISLYRYSTNSCKATNKNWIKMNKKELLSKAMLFFSFSCPCMTILMKITS